MKAVPAASIGRSRYQGQGSEVEVRLLTVAKAKRRVVHRAGLLALKTKSVEDLLPAPQRWCLQPEKGITIDLALADSSSMFGTTWSSYTP